MPPAQERLITNRRWWTLQPATVGGTRYIVAVALIGAALLLRYTLRTWLGPNVPLAGPTVGQPADLVSLSLFVAAGLGIAWMNHLLRNAERECRVSWVKGVTLEPIASITPTPSCPRMRPEVTLGTSPFRICRSVPQIVESRFERWRRRAHE